MGIGRPFKMGEGKMSYFFASGWDDCSCPERRRGRSSDIWIDSHVKMTTVFFSTLISLRLPFAQRHLSVVMNISFSHFWKRSAVCTLTALHANEKLFAFFFEKKSSCEVNWYDEGWSSEEIAGRPHQQNQSWTLNHWLNNSAAILSLHHHSGPKWRPSLLSRV